MPDEAPKARKKRGASKFLLLHEVTMGDLRAEFANLDPAAFSGIHLHILVAEASTKRALDGKETAEGPHKIVCVHESFDAKQQTLWKRQRVRAKA